jgi:hypothetical protein
MQELTVNHVRNQINQGRLCFYNKHINNEAIQALKSTLFTQSMFGRLRLQKCEVNQRSLIELVQSLRHSKVINFELIEMNIDLPVANAIADMLKESDVACLELTECKFDSFCLHYIFKALKDSKLSKLCMDFITDEHVNVLSKFLPQAKINIASFKCNELSELGIAKLCEAIDRLFMATPLVQFETCCSSRLFDY